MGKERGGRPARPSEPVLCSLGPMDKPLEFAARPANDIEIDPLEGRTQLRSVEVAVIDDPASNNGIVQLREVLQGFVAAVMKRPASDLPADALQGLRPAAGKKPCTAFPCHIVFRARNWKPKKSNEMSGKSSRRIASLQ